MDACKYIEREEEISTVDSILNNLNTYLLTFILAKESIVNLFYHFALDSDQGDLSLDNEFKQEVFTL